jgi:hypothetical protein
MSEQDREFLWHLTNAVIQAVGGHPGGEGGWRYHLRRAKEMIPVETAEPFMTSADTDELGERTYR